MHPEVENFIISDDFHKIAMNKGYIHKDDLKETIKSLERDAIDLLFEARMLRQIRDGMKTHEGRKYLTSLIETLEKIAFGLEIEVQALEG